MTSSTRSDKIKTRAAATLDRVTPAWLNVAPAPAVPVDPAQAKLLEQYDELLGSAKDHFSYLLDLYFPVNADGSPDLDNFDPEAAQKFADSIYFMADNVPSEVSSVPVTPVPAPVLPSPAPTPVAPAPTTTVAPPEPPAPAVPAAPPVRQPVRRTNPAASAAAPAPSSSSEGLTSSSSNKFKKFLAKAWNSL